MGKEMRKKVISAEIVPKYGKKFSVRCEVEGEKKSYWVNFDAGVGHGKAIATAKEKVESGEVL